MTCTFMSPTHVGRLFAAAAVTGLLCSASHAAFTEVVAEDDFDSYADTSFVVFTDGANALVPDGGGGNAVQYTANTGVNGGFLARGWDWEPIVQPGVGGPNTSTNLADYQVSFDVTIDSTYIPGNGLEVWLKDQVGQGDPENDPSASLYSIPLGGFSTGVPQTVTFTLDTSINDAPFGYTNGSGFDPTVDQVRVRFNVLDFNSPANTDVAFTVDNFSLTTIPEPSSVVILGFGCAVALCLARHRQCALK